MKEDIRKFVREDRKKEVEDSLNQLIKSFEAEGFTVEFGKIGMRSTYAFIHKDDGTEIVGYTFLKDLKHINENVGKLKALKQVLARKSMNSN